jgi:hypothetical protein
MKESPADKKEEYDLTRRKHEAYLKLITIAICEVSFNRGTLRKQIWSYL